MPRNVTNQLPRIAAEGCDKSMAHVSSYRWLKNVCVVLASQSPRRAEILSKIQFLKFSVQPSKFDETTSRLIIGSDTVVVLGDKILEKPGSKAEAVAMLKSLSGQKHTVVTGVALVIQRTKGEPLTHTFAETTQVQFSPLDAAAVTDYVASGEPMDKAGAYGIQGLAGCFVSGINGCYYNVMGFPLNRFCIELQKLRDNFDKCS